MMMTCTISGRVPDNPVVSKISGLLFEKEVIEKHIRDVGKCPITGVSLTMDDILAINTRRVPISNSDAQALKGSSSSYSKTAEGSSCPQFPDSIAKEIESHRKGLSQSRKNCRKISPSLATVNALRGYTFKKGYKLHKTITPGVLSLDIDNSKDIIVTGGADTNAVVFDLLSRKTVSTLSGHSKKVTSVKFVNKGELVVTGSGDNTVRVWKRSEEGSYKFKGILDNHTAKVRAVTIHPSQKYFVSASNCTWQFFDLFSESTVACCTGSEQLKTAVFHPDGHIFGACAKNLVTFWDIAQQDEILEIDVRGPVKSIAFSENGYSFATAGDCVKLWDLRFLRCMKIFPSDAKNAKTRSVDFDHSGRYLATGGAHISIYEIAASPDPIATFSDTCGIGDLSCVKFGKEAKYVAAARKLDSKLLLFGL